MQDRHELRMYEITVDNKLLAQWSKPLVTDFITADVELISRLKVLLKSDVSTKLSTFEIVPSKSHGQDELFCLTGYETLHDLESL